MPYGSGADRELRYQVETTFGTLPAAWSSGIVFECEDYNVEGLQTWRNLNFMKFCSYTLEEVFCIEWYKRYTRTAGKNEECMEKVAYLINLSIMISQGLQLV